MKMNYIAPLTETVYLSAQNILQDEAGNMDSHGKLPGDDPDLGANSGVFESEDLESKKGLWED